MNRLTIIGNLTRDPELRTTQGGVSVCSFTVAVNRRARRDQQQPEADFFRVSAWRELGENCAKWLIKGKKVAVVGPVGISTYEGRDGKTHAEMTVHATEVEFLSPAGQVETQPEQAPEQRDQQTGMQQVETDELPF